MTVTDGALKLISTQIALVVQLQEQADKAIARSDWQSVDRIISTIDTAFTTFLQGIQTMSIDVSALKTILSSGGGATEQFQSLQQSVASLTSQLEQSQSQLQQQQKDIQEIKDALTQLNSAAAGNT